MQQVWLECDHGLGSAEAVAFAAESIKKRSLEKARRADLLGALAIFGKPVDDELDPLAIIGRELMGESPVVQEWMKEGEQRGEQKGRRQSLRDLLVARFGERKVKPLDKHLDALTDLAQLEALFKQVAAADDWADVKKLLLG